MITYDNYVSIDISGSHILIVDDNNQNVQVIGEMLNKYNFKLSIASNGKNALNYLLGHQVDLILLDVMMPEMDGFEFLSKLEEKEMLSRIPVILLTALNSKEDKVRGFKAGAVDYIVKPFIKEEVIARINVHLRLSTTIKKMKEDSTRDELTGVYNRRFANEVILKQLAFIKRNNGEFVLCLIDVDNLKYINDKYGHNYGDDLIKLISSEILHNIRQSDYLFRIGGDEFLILLNKTNLDNLEIIINRVRNSLSQQVVCNCIPDFSYGAVYVNNENTKSLNQLIDECDTLMYNDKKLKVKKRV